MAQEEGQGALSTVAYALRGTNFPGWWDPTLTAEPGRAGWAHLGHLAAIKAQGEACTIVVQVS